MDLTKLGTDARQHAEEMECAADVARKERNRLNDATVLRRRFKELLGVDVLEDDLIWDPSPMSLQHGVIVDGAALVLTLPKYPGKDDPDQLVPKYVDEDGFHALDVSLTLSVHKVTGPETLGKVLDPRRTHGIVGRSDRYKPGVGIQPR